MEIVNKPWGYEKWVGQGRSYFLKEILIKAGFKTSLQYHEEKEETNYILSGRGVLTLNGYRMPLEPEVAFHILPEAIHRIEASTDLKMIEVSTLELDDVIRIDDDWDRKDGRIESEH